MNSTDLKACPFCGGDNLDDSSENAIVCAGCGGSAYADYPASKGRDVVTLWNTRTPQPAVGREEVALLGAVRRFIYEERQHARKMHAGAPTSRDAVDLAHADLMRFKVEDVDRALAQADQIIALFRPRGEE